MRYSLLSFVACPMCASDLICIVHEESTETTPEGLFPGGDRVSSGPGVGPAPPWRKDSAAGALLRRYATSAAPESRGLQFGVQTGLLACGECGRWFPIESGIPELLPDHLRDADREAALFANAAQGLPDDLRITLAAFRPSGDASSDPGAHHKHAEITLKDKVDEPGFYGPGYSSPFNPWNTSFTLYLITLLGNVFPLLDVQRGEVLVDSGCGYAWTTEWFYRSGVEAIGFDICRTYLDIGVQRMGQARPHLVVADVENLPIRSGSADAVLAYESFHHLPNRPAAMRSYDRALKPNGRVVLAEPGAAHEDAQVSVDVMKKYGILEKGMELEDVIGYAAGTSLGAVDQAYVVLARNSELQRPLDLPFIHANAVVKNNLFTLTKGGAKAAPGRPAVRRRVWPKVKRRIKAALLRIGLD
jgi:uncharacterized protein YbaR (Trm112 family)/SAM-dependent methyltransferase